jgi:hypothetical protein
VLASTDLQKDGELDYVENQRQQGSHCIGRKSSDHHTETHFPSFFCMPMRIPATVNRSQAQSTFNKREIRCLWNTYDHLQSSWLAREKTGFSQFKYRFRGE